ncbi:hypothetical protein [Azobacteroides phage ProJPt-Bp1]|uniref:Uncharacterized protein n=1 Tax=Azobacteroides phage ProJPt-Bp1 TaxID=1920526 RepID=A0A1V1FIN6_9CAUD|nr:hypothetical protein KNT10_gp34 [Azobacteroides phage ProJPt-Bp1]BAX03429.1 hypothetical protein [Azobacteroides phage ProJPt-Bp1]
MISPYINDQLFIGTTYAQAGLQPYDFQNVATGISIIAPGEISIITADNMQTIRNSAGGLPDNTGRKFCFVMNIGKTPTTPEFIISPVFGNESPNPPGLRRALNIDFTLKQNVPLVTFVYSAPFITLLDDREYQYLIRFLVRTPEQKHQYIDIQVIYRVPTGGDQGPLIDKMVIAINNHPYIGEKVTAARAGNTLTITEKNDHITDFDINGKEKFKRFDCSVSIMRNDVYNPIFPKDERFVEQTVNLTRTPVEGLGNWQQVASDEIAYLGRSGITNTTEFPVVIPKPRTEKGERYSLVEVTSNAKYRDADCKVKEQRDRIKAYVKILAADTDPSDSWARLTRQLGTLININ